MKNFVPFAFLFFAFAALASEVPTVLDAVVRDNQMIVKVKYEKTVQPFAILPFIQFPVKHVWNKTIQCPDNSKGDTTARISVAVSVKNEVPETQKQVEGEKELIFNLDKMCKGTELNNILINNAELSLQQS